MINFLDHPNILKLHDLYVSDKSFFLVTDFLEGDSLASFFESKVK